ncbi:MAG TPA: ABC-2 family transporter protein, partial [Symbiobacteriaceae bacterium]|nr:ABC-2 family transporter protein [Symbiobacteriaceae bacterium]
MKKYITAVRAEFANMRQFALNFALRSIQLPVAVLILLYIYRTIAGGGTLGTYSALKLSLYFVGVAVSGQIAMPAMMAMWESWEQINNGDLSTYLCRPVDYLWLRYARKLAPALVMAVCGTGIQV